jgi:DNA-binding LytR/AlgR family response regulator
MNHHIKIGIVEDELLIAEKVKIILTDIGYKVCEPVSNYDAALEMIKAEKPDFLLLDVNLGKEKDGIDIARVINEQFFLPFIFLTANSDKLTIDRAKEVRPYAYLVKPFTKEELFAAIEIALSNFSLNNALSANKKEKQPSRHYLFIWDGQRFIKILFSDIAYVESRENYVYVHTVNEHKIALRSTLQDFMSQLPREKFFRVHRSYVIQTELIKNMDYAEVTIAGITIPLGKTYRDELFVHLGIKD